MHLVWTGVAKALHERGDDALDFLLEEAGRGEHGSGEIFGFGISEAGNDLMLFGSRSVAAPQPDGGYRFTGTKVFTSLSPAYTRLGTMGLDTESADAPKIVYGFVDRDDPGLSRKDDWNTLACAPARARPPCSTPLTPAPSASCGASTPAPTPTR